MVRLSFLSRLPAFIMIILPLSPPERIDRPALPVMPGGYRVTEAMDGTFHVELWSAKGGRDRLIYKTRGFRTPELAEAWIVPVEDDPADGAFPPRSRVVYLKPRSS